MATKKDDLYDQQQSAAKAKAQAATLAAAQRDSAVADAVSKLNKSYGSDATPSSNWQTKDYSSVTNPTGEKLSGASGYLAAHPGLVIGSAIDNGYGNGAESDAIADYTRVTNPGYYQSKLLSGAAGGTMDSIVQDMNNYLAYGGTNEGLAGILTEIANRPVMSQSDKGAQLGDWADQLIAGTYNPDTAQNRANAGSGSGSARSGSAAAPYAEPVRPGYYSDWDTVKEQLARAALEMNYDKWAEGDSYAALADRYRASGNQAMQDTIGQMAARTGGLASSYAEAAAQQQYNNYMAQLEDAARQMYASERGDAIQNAQMAYDYADSDYQRYLDQLAQYNEDRSYTYQQYLDQLAQSNYEREWQNTLEQQAYARNQGVRDDARQRIDAYIAAGGSVKNLDPSILASSGYSTAEMAALEQYYAAQNAPKVTDGGSDRSYVPVEEPTAESVVDTMLGYGNDEAAYGYLLGLGMRNDDTQMYWKFYNEAKAAKEENEKFKDSRSYQSIMSMIDSGNYSLSTIQKMIENSNDTDGTKERLYKHALDKYS